MTRTMIRERFLFCLNELFGGNQHRMAKAIGCSQAAVSKVALGKQTPGRKLLDGLIRYAGVDAGWLMTGEGAPYGVSGLAGYDEAYARAREHAANLHFDNALEHLRSGETERAVAEAAVAIAAQLAVLTQTLRKPSGDTPYGQEEAT